MSRIILCWWNTSLSPLGKARETPPDLTIFQAVLNYLVHQLEIDFCALGEVSESDIEEIRKHLKGTTYEVASGIESIGRSRFSTCILFNTLKLNCRLGGHELILQENSKYRLAQRVLLTSSDPETFFHVFISHWPSRLNLAANDPLRSTFGDRLRQRIDEILKEDKDSKIILMGDYNDEPFDNSLSNCLRATRDRDLIKKKPTLLYNPFWRHLCHPEMIEEPSETRTKPESWGTYFHSNGNLFRWRTFDQMFFSSSLLGSSEWYLNEAKTSIIDFERYTTIVVSRAKSFDHLPIVATLERKKND